jgi:hypothetical protein
MRANHRAVIQCPYKVRSSSRYRLSRATVMDGGLEWHQKTSQTSVVHGIQKLMGGAGVHAVVGVPTQQPAYDGCEHAMLCCLRLCDQSLPRSVTEAAPADTGSFLQQRHSRQLGEDATQTPRVV